ncbi:MAG: hypothetical protein P4L10_09705 [Acidobacteriaceae bacterium]|nr:hypothetical protein [Acidobacteriaceae bacterium]
MKRISMLTAVLAAAVCVSANAQSAQDAKTPTKATKSHKKAETSSEELRLLREQLQKQQAEIDALKSQVSTSGQQAASATQTATDAQAQAAAATATATQASSSSSVAAEKVDTLSTSVTDLKTANQGLTETVITNQQNLAADIESPSALHYKGVSITPIGFFAAESFYRQRSLNSDINTPFNSTLFPGAAQYNTSEFAESARQSRLGVKVQGKLGKVALMGYFEGDFLGAGTTSNDNQSNSYVFRQRLFFGQFAFHNGFTITGGQTWSLVTETKTSTDALTEVLPVTPDAQYHVGFSWARQPGIRFQQKMGIATYALALESGENIFNVTNGNYNFFIGAAGVGGGLLNATANYSNNLAPDVILKAAFDTKLGHYEIGGIARWFRDRYYPGYTGSTSAPVTTPAVNDTKTGGGFFANAHIPMTKYFGLGLHVMQGDGVGRYGTSTLPDSTVHPDGTLALIRSSQGLGSLEFHPTPKFDLIGYAGAEYAQRTTYLSAGKVTGYAPITANVSGCYTEYTPVGTGTIGYSPAGATNCSASTRAVIEGTISGVYRFYNGPKGKVQLNIAYSILQRNAWTGTNGTSTLDPAGRNNMVFTSLRYYIP